MRSAPPGRPVLRRRDQGAVTVVFAMLVSSLVVVGMLALIVDIGRLYVEREELQNGADAGALAAARSCAQDRLCDPATFLDVAQSAAEQNARDGAALAALRCARVEGVLSTPCNLSDPQLTRCVGPNPADGDFVEIRTRTRTSDGGTLLPPVFGAAVIGSGHQGTQAAACARAAWGALAEHSRTLGFGIALCAFEALTETPSGGPGFTPADQIKAGTPDPSYEAEVRQRDCANPGDPPPGTGPGALAWLGPPGGECFRELEAGTDVPGTEITADWSGASCRTADGSEPLNTFLNDNRQPLVLPVYDSVAPGSGGSHTYHVAGFAYFLPAGYWFGPENAQPSWRTGQDCAGTGPAPSDPCLMGFFTEGTLLGTVGTGEGYGLKAIQLIG